MNKITRSATVAIAIVMLFLGCDGAFGQEHATLANAIEWLVAQQDETGAFKSKHYGPMKQGAATTSLALYSLSMLPDDLREKHTDAIGKAFEFLMPGTKARGRVANPDGSLDHPVYSTAMLLVAAKRLEYEIEPELATKLLDFLIRSQCVEGRGFDPINPNYGGWDVIGPDVMAGKTSGTNVSVARFVLEAFACIVPVKDEPTLALDETIIERVRESRQRALDWLKRLHKDSSDGGFYFSAQPGSALNKSQTNDGKPKSYGSATCDALLALNFAGDTSSETYTAANTWILTRTKGTDIGGFENQKDSGWPKALQFYYLQSLTRVKAFLHQQMLKELPEPGAIDLDPEAKDPATITPISLSVRNMRFLAERETDVQSVFKTAQHEDGRFQNKSALMRENDPLIATSFAIIALSAEPTMGDR